MRRLLSFLVLLIVAGVTAGAGAAGPGALDRSFGAGFGYIRYADSTNTVNEQGLGVGVQPDGKVLVAGSSGIDHGAVVVRFNADGSVDETFAERGVFRWKPAEDTAIAQRVVVLPDGKLLVLGYVGTAAKLLLLRLNADGTLDPSFGTSGVTVATATGWKAEARRVLFDDQGGIVVLWEPIEPALNRILLTRYTGNGVRDLEYDYGAGSTLIDTSGFGAVTTLPLSAAFDPLGRLVIFAAATNTAANTTLIYRLDRAGYPDATFGIGSRVVVPQANFAFYGHAWTVLTASDGYVLVEWMDNGVRLQKFNYDGTIARGFGTFGLAEFFFAATGVIPGGAVIRSDGTIVVAGASRPDGTNHAFVLAVTGSGALDTRFGTSVPQRLSTEGGWVAADLARMPNDTLAIGGTAIGAGSEDFLALRLDANANRVASFGNGGFTLWDGSDVIPESARGLWLQADGTLLTLNRQRLTAASDTSTKWNWRRFLADGNPDTSFGPGGKRALADAFDGPNVTLYAQRDAKIIVGRQVTAPGFVNRTQLIRYNPDGTRDTTFGSGGAVELVDDAQADQTARRPGIVETDDGKLLVATYGSAGLYLRRLTGNGSIDPTFGNGRTYAALDGRPQVGYTLAVQSDGRILVGAARIVVLQSPLPQQTVHADVVVRLTAEGALDPTFGSGSGIVPIQVEDTHDPQIVKILPLPDGKTIVVGNLVRLGKSTFFFARLNDNGTIDTSYGDHTDAGDGPGLYVWVDVYENRLNDAVIDASGRLVITGEYDAGPVIDRRSKAFVVRILPNGAIDGAFGGINQHIFFLERPEPLAAGNMIALGPNSIFVGGEVGQLGLVLKLEADGSALITSRPVIEFYNTQLNHYFITADPAEVSAIEQGAAGPGWQRTGRSFRAWLAPSGVPNSQVPGIPTFATPVCRFYGTPGVGPNSHFYTVDLAECDAVRNDPGWHYEGIAFYIVAPVNQICPFGTTPVLRAYNNRFAQNDSNHRYTTSAAILQAMVTQGWSAEGVAFCASVI